MQILIGSLRHDALQKTRDWFSAPTIIPVLADVVDWAKGHESEWGECYLIVETDLPGSGQFRATNIDLMVAFSDRVVVCEVKNHHSFKAAEGALFGTLSQVCRNFDLVQQHLTRYIDHRSVRPFVFVPDLDPPSIERLTRLQLSKSSLRHVNIVGGRKCQPNPVLRNGQPVYLPAALELRLREIPNCDLRALTGHAQLRLAELTLSEGRYTFHELSNAITYLETTATDVPIAVRLEPTHVPNLRPAELTRARELLLNARLAEVIGSPGIGKSSFIKEVLNSLVQDHKRHVQIAVVDLGPSDTIKVICQRLLRFFGHDPSDFHDERELIDRLSAVDAYVWIRSYDQRVRFLVKELAERIIGSATRNCSFVIESVLSLLPREHHVQLDTLWRRHIQEILERTTPSNASLSARLVSIHSGYNPAVALGIWKSGSPMPPVSQFSADASWLLHVFRHRLQREVFGFFVSAFEDAPFGLEVDVLRTAAIASFPGLLPSTVLAALVDVLVPLWSASAIDVSWVNRSDLPDALQADLNLSAWSMVSDLNPSLFTLLHKTFGDDAINTWHHETRLALEKSEGHPAFVAVTLGFFSHKLLPYCRSTFSTGSAYIPQVVRWLDRRMTERGTNVDEFEHYFERTVRFAEIIRYGRAQAIDLGLVPVEVPGHNKLQLHLALERVIRCFKGTKLDGEQFFAALNMTENSKVQAEMMYWTYLLDDHHSLDWYWWLFGQALEKPESFPPEARQLLCAASLACAARRVDYGEFIEKHSDEVLRYGEEACRLAFAHDDFSGFKSALQIYRSAKRYTRQPGG